jgi:tetratricopeptide (TPR) repeat protein
MYGIMTAHRAHRRSVLWRTLILFALLGALPSLTPLAAAAAETAQALYSRGLAQFHQEQYAAALVLFEQAVVVDPQDQYARYYRGVTYLQLQRLPEAIADLRGVLDGRPEITQAQLEMGVALVQAEQYAEAIPYLERAQQVLPEQAARAALFLGMAHLRLDQLDAARGDFERAAADPELGTTARYYQGVLDFQAQRWSQAQSHFEFVAAGKADSEIGNEAHRFLERMGARQAQPYHLYATAGLEYDSNVVIAPLDEAAKLRQGVSGQADGRVVLGAGGVYVPWRNNWLQLSVGYDFFQSLHFSLNSFNLQDHRPSVQLAGKSGPFSFGLFARYDYYLLGNQRFLQQGTGVPFVSYDEGAFGRTELSMRARRRDFQKQPYSGVLDSWNYGPGVRQVFNLGTPQRIVWIGYRYDRDDTLFGAGDAFAYDGNEVSVGTSWLFAESYAVDVTYAFRNEDYAQASGGRVDHVHNPIVALRWSINEHCDLALAYLGLFNDSNKVDFDYERHIASLSVTVRN